MVNIKYKRLSEKAVAPVKANPTDAGYDLTCVWAEPEISECGQANLVYHTDIKVEMPEGYFGVIVPRDNISKKGFDLVNGVVNPNEDKELVVKFRPTVDVIPAVYKEGERIAQLLILPVVESTFEEEAESNIEESAPMPIEQQESVIEAKDDLESADAVPSTNEEAAEPIEGSEEVQ